MPQEGRLRGDLTAACESIKEAKQQAEESYLSEETMLAQEEMGINRQRLEIPSNRNSEDT